MQVLFTDQLIDIYSDGRIQNITPITEEKTIEGIKLTDNSYSMSVDNVDGFFNDIALSTNWNDEIFRIINDDNEIIWDGLLTDMTFNDQGKTAQIFSRSVLSQYFKRYVAYTSGTWETPPEIAKSIMDTYGFTAYNAATINRSIEVCQTGGCYIRCFIDLGDNTTLRDALEKLGQYCGAYVYIDNNVLYFEVYEDIPRQTPISIDGDSQDVLRTLPNWRFSTNNLVNDYAIGFQNDADVPAIDSDNNNIGARSRIKFGTRSWGRTITGDDSGQVQFRDNDAAVFLGEIGIRQSHEQDLYSAPIEIALNLYLNHKTWIKLNNVFKFIYERNNWTNKLFQITKHTIDEQNNNINILAVSI